MKNPIRVTQDAFLSGEEFDIIYHSGIDPFKYPKPAERLSQPINMLYHLHHSFTDLHPIPVYSIQHIAAYLSKGNTLWLVQMDEGRLYVRKVRLGKWTVRQYAIEAEHLHMHLNRRRR